MAVPGLRTSVPCSKVEIRLRGRNLLDKDVTSKSDPCAVLFMQDKGKWYEHGRTENIKNSLNPEFVTAFEVDYYFEEVQKLRVALFDIDNSTPELNDDDFLGEHECTLGQVVSGSPYTKPLLNRHGKPAGKGHITILAEEVVGMNDVLHMKFKAQGLDKKDTFGKSDPYLEFLRPTSDGSWTVIHRTEVIKNTLNPDWKEIVIRADKLCAGNFEKPIKIDCYDYDNDGGHDFIGSFTSSVSEFTSNQQLQWPCINPKKQAKKKNYKDSGTVYLASCQVTKDYSFLDFIFGGLQINFTVGIDFTASNGDPRNSQSLHYINPYSPNEYEKAIQAVGEVVQDYDTDKMFPVLGFGARIPPSYDVSHEFPCNFNSSNPFCAGLQGVIGTYKACISQVQLYGPTNFAPIINHVARFGTASLQEEGAKNYYVLLIMTDGVISDMDATRYALVHASALPMSVIIVGVGEADFTSMNILDGDEGRLKTPAGNPCQRDIVQFVPYRDFIRAPPAELARHVLAEIPKQVTDYYKMQGIVPGVRPAAPPTM